MVICDHCETKNSLDSQFCKSCGREISEDAREVARAENAKLVAEGYSMLGEGRTEEAELIAKTVLEADESVTAAWSLLGMVYERKHEFLGALECYEKVLSRNPDSALDKIKVSQLKASLERSMAPAPRASKMPAFAAAAATVVFVATVGAIMATMMPRSAAASTADNRMASNGQPESSPVLPGNTKQTAQNPAGNSNLGPGDVGPIRSGTTQGQDAADQGTPNDPQSYRGSTNSGARRVADNGWRSNPNSDLGTLPSAGPNGGQTDLNQPDSGFKPITVGVVPRIDPNDPKPDGGDSGTRDPGTSNQADPPKTTPRKGTIEIRVHDDAESKGDLDETMKTARERHLGGQLDGAARSYEHARQIGGDNGTVNQRLGMVYEKMGKKSEAAAAYQRAIQKLENEARSGKPGAKEALDSTKQALKNLNGG